MGNRGNPWSKGFRPESSRASGQHLGAKVDIQAWAGQVQSDQGLGTAGCEGEAGRLPTVCGSLIRLAQKLKMYVSIYFWLLNVRRK